MGGGAGHDLTWRGLGLGEGRRQGQETGEGGVGNRGAYSLPSNASYLSTSSDTCGLGTPSEGRRGTAIRSKRQL